MACGKRRQFSFPSAASLLGIDLNGVSGGFVSFWNEPALPSEPATGQAIQNGTQVIVELLERCPAFVRQVLVAGEQAQNMGRTLHHDRGLAVMLDERQPAGRKHLEVGHMMGDRVGLGQIAELDELERWRIDPAPLQAFLHIEHVDDGVIPGFELRDQHIAHGRDFVCHGNFELEFGCRHMRFIGHGRCRWQDRQQTQ